MEMNHFPQDRPMSRKRRNTSSPESEIYSPKRQCHESTSPASSEEDEYEESKINPVYGQLGAFPGISAGDGELFYGPASNGIEYLRMVR